MDIRFKSHTQLNRNTLFIDTTANKILTINVAENLDGSVEDDLVSIESENDFNEDWNDLTNGDVIFANSTGTTKPVYASGIQMI